MKNLKIPALMLLVLGMCIGCARTGTTSEEGINNETPGNYTDSSDGYNPDQTPPDTTMDKNRRINTDTVYRQ